jgi:hypothetical protein
LKEGKYKDQSNPVFKWMNKAKGGLLNLKEGKYYDPSNPVSEWTNQVKGLVY